MFNRVWEKLQRLRAYFANPAYPEDAQQLQAWQKQLEAIALREKLGENPIIKEIVDKLGKEILEMNRQLLENREIKEDERKRMMDKRNLYRIHREMYRFDAKDFEEIESQIDKELELISK